MIYDVRLREILIHEFQVENEDLKGAFLTAMKKAHSKKFKSTPIRRYFELESLNQGKTDEFTPASKSSKRTDRIYAKRKDR
jgi:hypothetical protein